MRDGMRSEQARRKEGGAATITGADKNKKYNPQRKIRFAGQRGGRPTRPQRTRKGGTAATKKNAPGKKFAAAAFWVCTGVWLGVLPRVRGVTVAPKGNRPTGLGFAQIVGV